MRIDKIHLKNFKLFEDFELMLHPEFTLLIGENGSGKTSIIDGLAVAAGVWLLDVPDSSVANSRRPIYTSEIRVRWKEGNERPFFLEQGDVVVSCTGEISGNKIELERSLPLGAKRMRETGAKDARALINGLYAEVAKGRSPLLPVIACYGAGRGWMAHNERKSEKAKTNYANRWSAFYDCLNERIRFADLKNWFRDELVERGNRNGSFRPGYEIVKGAILRCLPDANDAWYDSSRKDIVIKIADNPQPSANLSAGQKMMLALVADIAIKCVTQNNYLVPPDKLGPDDDPIPRVLKGTPGLVLIDEIDVHLHPRWQRRVIEDLRTTFPRIQFVATTHSPQIIGQVNAECIRVVSQGKPANVPHKAFGLDSNWILEHLMEAEKIDENVGNLIEQIEADLEQFEFESAEKKLDELRKLTGETVATTRLDIGVRNAKAITEPKAEYERGGRNLRSIDLRSSDEVRKRLDEDLSDDETH